MVCFKQEFSQCISDRKISMCIVTVTKATTFNIILLSYNDIIDKSSFKKLSIYKSVASPWMIFELTMVNLNLYTESYTYTQRKSGTTA